MTGVEQVDYSAFYEVVAVIIPVYLLLILADFLRATVRYFVDARVSYATIAAYLVASCTLLVALHTEVDCLRVLAGSLEESSETRNDVLRNMYFLMAVTIAKLMVDAYVRLKAEAGEGTERAGSP